MDILSHEMDILAPTMYILAHTVKGTKVYLLKRYRPSDSFCTFFSESLYGSKNRLYFLFFIFFQTKYNSCLSICPFWFHGEMWPGYVCMSLC